MYSAILQNWADWPDHAGTNKWAELNEICCLKKIVPLAATSIQSNSIYSPLPVLSSSKRSPLRPLLSLSLSFRPLDRTRGANFGQLSRLPSCLRASVSQSGRQAGRQAGAERETNGRMRCADAAFSIEAHFPSNCKVKKMLPTC